MKKLCFYLYIIIAALCCCNKGYAAQTLGAKASYNIDYIGVENGLSQNDILDIFQDSFGFVWIATNDGLNRYDGMQFKIFTKGELGLGSALILNICEDNLTNLWISTADRGLYYYLRNENRFVHISQMSDDSRVAKIVTARYVTMGHGNEVWLYARMTNNIIQLQYDPEALRITESTHYSISSLTYAQCCGMEYVNDDIYICTYFGLLKYSHTEQQVVRIPNFDHTIRDIEVRGDKLYVATPIGLFSYDINSGKKVKVIKNLKKLFRICWDKDDLYIATQNGLFVASLDTLTNKFNPTRQIDSYKSFSTNTMRNIAAGGIWAGFDKESIRVYQHNTKPFELCGGFGNNHIMPIFLDHNQDIWIGTDGSGYFSVGKDATRPTNKRNFLDGNGINAIAYSPYTSKYYVTSPNGITEHAPYGIGKQLTTISSTKSMIADGKYLWAACYSNGLLRINLETNEIYNFTPNNSALKSDITRCVLKSRDGKIWISTAKGLFYINEWDKDEVQPKLIEVLPEVCSEHYISQVFESRSGDIWYGTLGSGLFRLNRDEQDSYNIEEYNTSNLLPNNTVKAITEDRDGLIWASLNNGLCAIDVKNNTSTSYDTNNGLQNSEFHDLSALCTPDNTIFFGGVKGLTIFNPDDIKIDYTQGTLHLTDIEIFNKSILDNPNKDKVTPLSIEQTEDITLRYNQNSFTLSFSSFNFIGAKKQQYLYKLEGFDKEWQTAKANNNSAAYTNMSFGRYRFVVRCKNEDGLLNPNELVVNIKIKPPYYLTWYAILFYITILTTALIATAKYYQSHLLRLNAVKLAKMEKRKVEELLTVRTNFFTNVSHEFRTPLTLILSPLQQLMSDKEIMENKEWREHLKTMSYNGESLMRLANDFLNFSKRESHNLKLNLQLGRLDILIKQLSKHLSYMAHSKGVELNYKPALSGDIELYFDAAHIEQIVYNLTSNAIKHTPTGGEVTLSIKDTEDSIILTVKDSGVGIPADMQPQIFDRFMSRDSAASAKYSGIGIGLSLTKDLVELHDGKIAFESQEGIGTTFMVILPKNYSEEPQEESKIEVQEPAAEPTQAPDVQTEACGDSASDRDVMLVVDDNEQILGLLSSLFSSRYKVITAADGAEALGLAQSFIPDIIISDVMMPRMDGYEFCDKIKSGESTSHIPLILLTAKDSTADMAAGYRHKADGYRIKPFNNDVLIEQVRSLLDNRRTLAGRIKQNETAFEVEKIGISSDADKQMVKRFVTYVEENISNPELMVSDVCSAVGLTQVVLNKKLKSLFNMTANSMIRNIRLKRAAELLRTGRYTVSSITYDVGFNDLRHFRESFLKEYGMFPQAYKKKYNEGESAQEE